MKLKMHESKLGSEVKLGKTEESGASPLRDIDSHHLIDQLEENIRMRETPILERLKPRLKK